MRRTGIVMNVQANIAIVLTRDGEFCEVPCTQGVHIGSEIDWETDRTAVFRDRRGRRHTSFGMWRNIAVSGAAAVVAIAGGVWYYGAQTAMAATPYAYVSVEINPDVSLVLNKKLRVIQVSGLNDDGTQLLQDLHLRGELLRDALHNIVDASVDKHMLPAQDNIVVTAAPAQKNTDVQAVQGEIQKDMQAAVGDNAVAKHLSPKVYTLRISKTVWKAASGAHVPPGKLATYLIAKKHHLAVLPSTTEGTVTRSVLDNASNDDSATTDDAQQVQNALRDIPTKVVPAHPAVDALGIVGHVPPSNPENIYGIHKIIHPGAGKNGHPEKAFVGTDAQNLPSLGDVFGPGDEHGNRGKAHQGGSSDHGQAGQDNEGHSKFKENNGHSKGHGNNGHPKDSAGKDSRHQSETDTGSLLPAVTGNLPGALSSETSNAVSSLASNEQPPASYGPGSDNGNADSEHGKGHGYGHTKGQQKNPEVGDVFVTPTDGLSVQTTTVGEGNDKQSKHDKDNQHSNSGDEGHHH